MACGGPIQQSIGNAGGTLSHIAFHCCLKRGGELSVGHLLLVFLCETLMQPSIALIWLQSDWNVADLRASQSCETESKGDPHCPKWLKENDHFKIHNSQVPAIYSWEEKKVSELLFIKGGRKRERERRGARRELVWLWQKKGKKRLERKGNNLWESVEDFSLNKRGIWI